MVKRNRSIQKIIRLTEEENNYINRLVKDSPFNNFQNYARLLLITGEVRFFDYTELHHLIGEVHRLGNNVNQVARMAHVFSNISDDEIADLTDEIKKLTILVESKLTEEKNKEKKKSMDYSKNQAQKLLDEVDIDEIERIMNEDKF